MTEIIAPSREIIKPHHPEDRDYELYVMLGVDTFAVIRGLVSTTTGQPKSAVIRSCFGLKAQEKDCEFAQMPQNKGEYPIFVVRTNCTSREFHAASAFATINRMRLGVEPKKMYISLGFQPAQLKEGE